MPKDSRGLAYLPRLLQGEGSRKKVKMRECKSACMFKLMCLEKNARHFQLIKCTTCKNITEILVFTDRRVEVLSLMPKREDGPQFEIDCQKIQRGLNTCSDCM